MNRPGWFFILLASIGLLLGVLLKALEKPGHILEARANPLSAHIENRKALPFSLSDHRGRRFRLSEFEGKFILLNFWATWCKPCRNELPELAVLTRALVGKPAQLVLVSVDENWSAIDRLAAEFEKPLDGGNPPQAWKDAARLIRGQLEGSLSLIDPGRGIAKSYGTSKFPETYLIGPRGDIVYRFIGPKLWTQPEALDFILKAIDAGGHYGRRDLS